MSDDNPNFKTLIEALLASCGVSMAMPVERADKTGGIYSSISSYENVTGYSYSRKRNTEETCKAATEHIEKLFAESKAIHEKNLPALENNKLLHALVSLFMTEIGIKGSWQEKKVTGRMRAKTTWIKHDAGWIGDMNRDISIMDYFYYAESTYRDQLKRIESYRTAGLAKEAEERKQAEAAEIARKEAEGLLPELEVMTRHGESICYGEHPDFETVSGPTFMEEWRWGNAWDVTVKSKKTGKVYTTCYRTASGDGGGFDDCNGDVEFTEVQPVTA